MNDRDDLADLHGDRIAITDARLEGFWVGDPRPETAGDRPWKRFVFTSEAGACGMSDPYDTDAVTWAEQQASLLRRIAAGERANDQIDWEDVGGREREKVTKAFIQAIRHKLCLLGWPHSVAVHLWEPEVRIHLATARRRYRNSMRQYITSESWQEDYQSALLETASHMADEWPLRVALLSACPWSLDELLAEGEAARHWKPA
jgi:hypothetical protein